MGAGLWTACDIHSPVGPGTLASITVTPTVTLPITGTQQFTATGWDAAGVRVAIEPVWTVVAGGGGIDQQGMFTAGTVPGVFPATIRAASEGRSGTASVTVAVGALARIAVSPNPMTLPMTGVQQYTAVGMDASGNVVPIAPVWSVVAGGGDIGSAGSFTAGLVPGTFPNTISAVTGGITGFATLTVAADPRTGVLASIAVAPDPSALTINELQQFVAVGRDAGGGILAITPVWSVVAGGGAINGTGQFVAGTAPGNFPNTVRATSGSISGLATVSVSVGTLVTIIVSPGVASLGIGGVQQFTAAGRDAGGNVVAIEPVWTIIAGGGAITGAGLFKAGTVPGAFPNTVRATSGGIAGLATVQVSAGTLATIVVTPSPALLGINGIRQFTAMGKDTSGNIVVIAPVWSVVAGGGVIDAAGLFTAGTTPGTFINTVRAASGAVSGFAAVVVSPGPPASITISPDTITLIIRSPRQFSATGRDVAGNIVPIAPVWTVMAGGGAIDASGLFTAGPTPGQFPNTVRASSGGMSVYAGVNVIAGPIATISVSPDPTSLAINGTRQFTATGRDVGGNIVPTDPVWTVVAGGGTINAAGLFTAGTTPGSFAGTVRALCGGISAFATVDVTTGPAATITVSPNPVTLAINSTTQFTAVGWDAGGNNVPITPVWSVVAGGGVISSTGLFTAGTTPGSFAGTVRAASVSASGFASVDVTIGVLSTITVSPDPTSLAINGTRQFTVVGTDAGGNVVAFSPTWSVVNGGGTINGLGLFTAGMTLGSFANTVRALSGAVSGFATVDVTVGPLATITVSPDPGIMPVNGTTQFTATGADAGGNPVAISPAWSVVNAGGTIGGTGLFTAGSAAGTFTNTVRALHGGVSGFATAVDTALTPPPPLVDLGDATTHGILGNTTVTCVGLASVGGDVGVAPGSAITGFPPCTLSGDLHPGDAYANAAHNSLSIAFAQLNGEPCDVAVTIDLGGQTLPPGVYCSAATQAITGEVFLDAQGDPNANFVIRSTTTLLTAALSRVTLLNNAQAKNVYWVVGSSATLGAGSFIAGNIVAFTSITVADNVTMVGRALAAGAAVTLGTGVIITLP